MVAAAEAIFARAQRAFEIERADYPVLRRAERQIDKGDGALGGALRCAGIRTRARIGRRTAEAAAFHGRDRRQDRGKRTRGGRFTGPAIAEDHHASDGWIDGGEQQGLLHFVLCDDG